MSERIEVETAGPVGIITLSAAAYGNTIDQMFADKFLDAVHIPELEREAQYS